MGPHPARHPETRLRRRGLPACQEVWIRDDAGRSLRSANESRIEPLLEAQRLQLAEWAFAGDMREAQLRGLDPMTVRLLRSNAEVIGQVSPHQYLALVEEQRQKPRARVLAELLDLTSWRSAWPGTVILWDILGHPISDYGRGSASWTERSRRCVMTALAEAFGIVSSPEGLKSGLQLLAELSGVKRSCLSLPEDGLWISFSGDGTVGFGGRLADAWTESSKERIRGEVRNWSLRALDG